MRELPTSQGAPSYRRVRARVCEGWRGRAAHAVETARVHSQRWVLRRDRCRVSMQSRAIVACAMGAVPRPERLWMGGAETARAERAWTGLAEVRRPWARPSRDGWAELWEPWPSGPSTRTPWMRKPWTRRGWTRGPSSAGQHQGRRTWPCVYPCPWAVLERERQGHPQPERRVANRAGRAVQRAQQVRERDVTPAGRQNLERLR